jgi:hypothetical protein
MKHACPICGKRIPKVYREAHKRFHLKKQSNIHSLPMKIDDLREVSGRLRRISL